MFILELTEIRTPFQVHRDRLSDEVSVPVHDDQLPPLSRPRLGPLHHPGGAGPAHQGKSQSHWTSSSVVEIVSQQEMKCHIGPLAKLDCFRIQKRFDAFPSAKPKPV